MLSRLLMSSALAMSSLVALPTHSVETRPLVDVTSQLELSAPATLVSLNNTTVSAQLLANVKTIHVKDAETVKKGQKLITLDCEDYQLDLTEAQANFSAAETRKKLSQDQFKRAESLLAKELASIELRDVRESDLHISKAEHQRRQVELKRAELNVSRCDIVAPFDGVVVQRQISEGQLANIGTPLLAIIDTDTLELSAQVPQKMAGSFNKSQSFWFESGARFPVTLNRIGAFIDSETRNREVRFDMTADKPPVGAAGKLIWTDQRRYIPPRFITLRNGKKGIFLVEENRFKFYSLENAVPGRPHPIDLPDETLIAVSDLANLQEGDAVSP